MVSEEYRKQKIEEEQEAFDQEQFNEELDTEPPERIMRMHRRG